MLGVMDKQKWSWTEDELNFLQEKWGVIKIETIARKLDRSYLSIKNKAFKSGLRDPRYCYADGLTINQLAEALNVSYGIVGNWIDKYELPAKQKVFAKSNRVKIINYDDFWEWAEENKHMIDFARVEKYTLGPEPDWVDIKRKADILKKQVIKTTPWTKEDDAKLLRLLRAFKYTYPEIAKRLKRSEAAVKRRCSDLRVKERPIRLNNHVKYTVEDEHIIEEMYEKGYCIDLIAQRLNKSALGLRGKMERMGYRFKNGVPIKKEVTK